jgi:hypothetical protein
LKTLKIRIKDSTIKKALKQKASAVNYVWNYCNQASKDHVDKYDKWLTGIVSRPVAEVYRHRDDLLVGYGGARDHDKKQLAVTALCFSNTEAVY